MSAVLQGFLYMCGAALVVATIFGAVFGCFAAHDRWGSKVSVPLYFGCLFVVGWAIIVAALWSES